MGLYIFGSVLVGETAQMLDEASMLLIALAVGSASSINCGGTGTANGPHRKAA